MRRFKLVVEVSDAFCDEKLKEEAKCCKAKIDLEDGILKTAEWLEENLL